MINEVEGLPSLRNTIYGGTLGSRSGIMIDTFMCLGGDVFSEFDFCSGAFSTHGIDMVTEMEFYVDSELDHSPNIRRFRF